MKQLSVGADHTDQRSSLRWVFVFAFLWVALLWAVLLKPCKNSWADQYKSEGQNLYQQECKIPSACPAGKGETQRDNTSSDMDFSPIDRSKFQLIRFRLAQYSLFQMSGVLNSTYSGTVSWTPEYSFNDHFSLVGTLGVVPLLKGSTSSLFLSFNSAVYFAAKLKHFVFEAGPGGQIWFIKPAIPSFSAGSNIHYKFSHSSEDQGILAHLDSVFSGYAHLFQSPAAHEFRIGTQIRF